MRKILIFTFIIALTLAGNVVKADCNNTGGYPFYPGDNPSFIKNDKPVGGDILVGDTCRTLPSPLWSQEAMDGAGNWALVTSDTDLNQTVYDDYSVDFPIEALTVWYGDLVYSQGWSECYEAPMPVTVYFAEDIGGMPDTANPTAVYTNIDLNPVFW